MGVCGAESLIEISNRLVGWSRMVPSRFGNTTHEGVSKMWVNRGGGGVIRGCALLEGEGGLLEWSVIRWVGY